MQHSSLPSPAPSSSGWCSRCGIEHRLHQGGARGHALALMQELEDSQRIDYQNAPADADPGYSTDYLFGEARGQMFGLLECRDDQGRTVILRAFSSLYNGARVVPGWVPPVFDVAVYDRIIPPVDRQINALGRRISALEAGSDALPGLKRQRKLLSRNLMKELHSLYELRNFHAETRPLGEFFTEANGIPAGAGDCCAPKLLNQAARQNLQPLGLAEFFWGKANRSGTREHGQFYSSCTDKCQPILGFMLCGAGI